MLILDWEESGWRVVGSGVVAQLRRDEVLDVAAMLTRFPTERVWVIESPHLQPRNFLSKAQVYAHEELVQLDEQLRLHGVVVRMAPGRMAHRVRHDVYGDDGKYDKAHTADAWHHHLTRYPRVLAAMKRFTYPPSDVVVRTRQDAWAIREDVTRRLNALRWSDGRHYGPDDPEVARMLAALREAYARSAPQLLEHTEELATFFRVRQKFVGSVRRGDRRLEVASTAANPQVMSVWVAVREADGSVRRDPRTGRPVGVDFVVRHVLRDHMYGAKGVGGVARSNLWHFGQKTREQQAVKQSGLPALGELDASPEDVRWPGRERVWNEVLQIERRRYRTALRALVRTFRDAP